MIDPVHPKDTAAVARTAPRPQRGTLVLLSAAAMVILVVAAFLAALRKLADPSSRGGLVVTKGVVELASSAPQWKYLVLATAENGVPLPPVPAPARVTVDDRRSVPIFSPLSGRVEQVIVQLGQQVRPRDKLLAIRSSSLPELRREVERERAALGVKVAINDRVRDLVKLQAVPEKELVLAEQERKEAELTLKAAEGKARSLQLGTFEDGSLFWLRAGTRGTVIDRRALVGMEVAPDRTEPLLVIADLAEVIVVADVLERDTAGLEIGKSAKVIDAGRSHEPLDGTIEYIADTVDPVRRTVAVRVRVVNRERTLRPKAFAQVVFSPEESAGIVVPARAVVTDKEESVVFVRRPDADAGTTRLDARRVLLGRVRDGRAEIVSGINEGDTYVSRGALLLFNALALAN